jgi:multimeric flavodoxin WrbA
MNDPLKPILDAIDRCDGLILGSPIYLSEVTSSMRAFIERLVFQYISYRKDRATFFKRRIGIGLIWTMNVPETSLDTVGYTARFKEYESMCTRIFGQAQTLLCTETWQTEDYGKYDMTMFDENERKKRREEVFPGDLQKAFELGARLALGA